MKQLRIVVSSTRPGRIGPTVAEWVASQAPASEWEVELLDLSSLPFFDEEDMPRNGNYAKSHTKDWASKVFESDAIVVVTPQYNRSFPAPIKNAIDYLFAEWDAKPIALVGYGWSGATGLVFTQDVSPAGELDVTDERRAELGALLDALAAKVDEPVGATA